jgi:hypothetical protein
LLGNLKEHEKREERFKTTCICGCSYSCHSYSCLFDFVGLYFKDWFREEWTGRWLAGRWA